MSEEKHDLSNSNDTPELRQYALLYGLDYYPGGGWNDFRGTYVAISAAIEAGRTYADSEVGDAWFQVVDLTSGEIVATEADDPTPKADRELRER